MFVWVFSRILAFTIPRLASSFFFFCNSIFFSFFVCYFLLLLFDHFPKTYIAHIFSNSIIRHHLEKFSTFYSCLVSFNFILLRCFSNFFFLHSVYCVGEINKYCTLCIIHSRLMFILFFSKIIYEMYMHAVIVRLIMWYYSMFWVDAMAHTLCDYTNSKWNV